MSDSPSAFVTTVAKRVASSMRSSRTFPHAKSASLLAYAGIFARAAGIPKKKTSRYAKSVLLICRSRFVHFLTYHDEISH